jgi:hypothetical protein
MQLYYHTQLHFHFHYDEYLQFLIEYDEFFGSLSSPDADMNNTLLQKHLQIYSQFFTLIDEFQQVNKPVPDSMQALLPRLHYQCGCCFYRLEKFQPASKI